MPKTAVLIPCYNEAATIRKVVEDFKRELPHADIYVYDNNSTDGTDRIARYEYKQGKGNVVRAMFRDIEADCYIMVDGDDTYPASFAPALERLVLEGKADMAVGDRLSSTYFTENKRLFHNSGNMLVRNLINLLFHADLHDIMTGARAFNRDFVKTYPIVSKGFEIETEMTIFALDNNFHIAETPIEYQDRPAGSESKLNTYSDGIKVLKTIGTLFRDTRPMLFFSLISLLLILIGLAFFIPILVSYFRTGLVLRFPTLIVATSVFIIAILNFFCGLVLSVLKNQHRQDFEQKLTIIRYLSNNQNK